MTPGSPWTPEHVGALRRMAADGRSDSEIGAALGRSTAAVCYARRVRNIPAGAPKPGDAWTPARLAAGGEMRARGMSNARIAERLGLTVSAVESACVRHGLTAKPIAVRPRLEGPYGRAAVAWARANIGDPQAKLIVGIMLGISGRVFADADRSDWARWSGLRVSA